MNKEKIVSTTKKIFLALLILIGAAVSIQIGMIVYFAIAVYGVYFIYQSVT